MYLTYELIEFPYLEDFNQSYMNYFLILYHEMTKSFFDTCISEINIDILADVCSNKQFWFEA